ncbi:hypothetical protein ACWGK5_27370 [Rhodococcus qingshengii]
MGCCATYFASTLPSQVQCERERTPDAVSAQIVSPSRYGTCADLAIASECHRRGKPLIVDEAWGANLPFHEELPPWAMDAGADVCMVSVHKMRMGFERWSVFHAAGRPCRHCSADGVRRSVDDHGPQRIIYSALDGWRRQMVETGHELLDTTLTLVTSLRDDTNNSQILGGPAPHMHESPDMRPGAGPCAPVSPPAPRSIRAAPALGGDAKAVRRANIVPRAHLAASALRVVEITKYRRDPL